MLWTCVDAPVENRLGRLPRGPVVRRDEWTTAQNETHMSDQQRRVLARPQDGETYEEFALRFMTPLIGEERAKAAIKALQERKAQEVADPESDR